MKYEIEKGDSGPIWINVIGKNSRQETMKIEIIECENPGGKKALPYLWCKDGFIDRVLNTYLCINTYVHDSEGGCRGDYNPTVKWGGERNVINFNWMFENTEENKQKLINECIRRFESATGPTATQIKMEKVRKFAEENGLEVYREIPDGWRISHFATDPYGAVSIINNERFFTRDETGKLMLNPDYKRALLVED